MFFYCGLIITLMSNCCFSQNIPCSARRDFLEHVGVVYSDHKTFEVNLVQRTAPTRSFRVLCTNTMGLTYFSGASWTDLVIRYGMESNEKCTFFLDHGDVSTYFTYEPAINYDSSANNYDSSVDMPEPEVIIETLSD